MTTFKSQSQSKSASIQTKLVQSEKSYTTIILYYSYTVIKTKKWQSTIYQNNQATSK
jgi:hypothetical protein